MVSYSPEARELLPVVAGNTRAVSTADTAQSQANISTLVQPHHLKSSNQSNAQNMEDIRLSQVVLTPMNKM